MRAAARLLEAAAVAPAPAAVDSDLVIILASLLCALICVVGLALVARCAWLRRAPQPQAPPTKGLKKSELRALPKVPYEGSLEGKLVDCVICLAEFAEGDEVRVLPQCGHGFHALCVDRWLVSHSSCPSCRRTPVLAPPPSRCRRCGATSEPGAAAAAAASSAEGGAKARQDGAADSSLT